MPWIIQPDFHAPCAIGVEACDICRHVETIDNDTELCKRCAEKLS